MYSAFFLLIQLFGCEDIDRGSPKDAKILVIGDSIFEWHIWNQHSAPEHLEDEVGISVFNNARSGSLITEEISTGIRNQYIEGDWKWVVMDGGGNDLNTLCQCGNCNDVQDEVESTYKEFLLQLLEQEDLKIIIWGYYGLPKRAKYGFDECHDDFEELSRRQKTLSDMNERIIFVDGRVKITGDDTSYFYIDKLHPSRKGAETIGRQLSEVIKSSSTD